MEAQAIACFIGQEIESARHKISVDLVQGGLMALRSHLSIGENEHRFRDVAEKLEARSINLFIGAGLSVPCGMRGWTAFLQLLAQKAFIEREVSGLLLDDKYEEAGELCYKRLGHEFFEEVLINEFGPAGISSERLNGAVKYLRDLQSVADSRLVITTNYDRVIEAVFRARGKNFAEVVPGGQPELLRRLVASGELCLLKLHGDVRNPVGRVLRKHDYENAYGTPDEHTVDVTLPLPNILFTIFQGRSLLFLGCSLGLDRTMGLLKMISEKYPFAPVHHAILENVFSTERDRAARDRDLLNNYKIAAIWYARGEHHCVPDLIRQLLKSVTGHVAQGLRPDWAAFAFGLDCAEDMLDRDDLCEVDFDAGKAIKPNKLESVLEIILSDGRPAAGKHVAISGIPGSGKSAFAAWIDYTLCEQGIPSVYCPGKQYQTQNDLTEKLATLPRNTVAIIDDVHLVPRQVEALRNTRAVNELCLVLLGRPAIFEEMRGNLRSLHSIELRAKDGAEVAKRLAGQYYHGNKLKDLLARTQNDLVFTKWMLSGEAKLGMPATDKMLDRAEAQLKRIREIYGTGVIQAFVVLSCFRSLELPAKIEALVTGFGCSTDDIEILQTKMREVVLVNDEVILQRHPKLASLFARAADHMPGWELIFYHICKAVGVPSTATGGSSFWSVILGAIVANGIERMPDLVNRLIYGGLQAKYEEVARIATELELSKNSDGEVDDEKRLGLAFAAANGMRRVKGGEAALKLLSSLREKLAVTDMPDASFAIKGYLLYQEAYLAWLTNNTNAAAGTFESSAKADEQFASELKANPAKSSFHQAKALMSRIIRARMVVETLAITSRDGGEPAVEVGELKRCAELFSSATDTLSILELQVSAGDKIHVKRFRWNALLHLAQTRAWLGDEKGTKEALASARKIDLETARDTELGGGLAKAQLAYVQGNFRRTISILGRSPEVVLKAYAGETSGLRAQLLARAHRRLGDKKRFEAWCRWLIDKCPSDAGNGPAIEWAQAALSRG